jgi:hypothetical protein
VAVYHSRFAVNGIVPSVRGDFARLKRFAAVVSVLILVALAGYGLWRATAGTPQAPMTPVATGHVGQA